MTARRPVRSEAALGVAISASEVVVTTAAGEVVRQPFVAGADGDGPAQSTASPNAQSDALRHAVRAALRDGVGKAPTGALRIALLPPWVEAGAVALPPVSAEDARRLLERAPERHFVGVSAPVVASASSVRHTAEAGDFPTRLAAAASASVLRALQEAARAEDWSLETVVPAITAWGLTHPARSGVVQIVSETSIVCLAVSDGTPLQLRRFRRHGDEAAMQEACASMGGAMHRIHDPAHAAAMALAGAAPAGGWPMALSLEATSPAREHTPTSRTVWWSVAALLLFAASAPALAWWEQRALDAVRAERQALAPTLAATAPERARQAQARVMAAHVRDASRDWPRVLAAITEALPGDAHLTSLRLRGDSLWLEGDAARAGAAFTALSASPMFDAVSAAAPVRRETAIDGTVIERFTFTARVRRQP